MFFDYSGAVNSFLVFSWNDYSFVDVQPSAVEAEQLSVTGGADNVINLGGSTTGQP